MTYSKQNQKQILEDFTVSDYNLLRQICFNEKVFYLIKKFVATPGCGFSNIENLLEKAKKNITLRR